MLGTSGGKSRLCGGCPVHSRVFSSTCDLSLLDDSNTHVKTKNVSRHCQTYPRGQKSPLVEKHGSTGMCSRDPCCSLSGSSRAPMWQQQPQVTSPSGQNRRARPGRKRWPQKGPTLTKERHTGGSREDLEEVGRNCACVGGGLDSPAGNGVTLRRGDIHSSKWLDPKLLAHP